MYGRPAAWFGKVSSHLRTLKGCQMLQIPGKWPWLLQLCRMAFTGLLHTVRKRYQRCANAGCSGADIHVYGRCECEPACTFLKHITISLLTETEDAATSLRPSTAIVACPESPPYLATSSAPVNVLPTRITPISRGRT